ncbi:hypothetical protein [Maridesulfovibrio sp. FT414]|uniref:hypothetical protein n=1 Tax=Maridesulfovibrio sp. FT414 TaxID=2979469 RepID=UPI003D8013AD
MYRFFSLLLVAIVYLNILTPALAADLPRILILGDDRSPETIARDSRPFTQVQNEIANALLNDGFDVKDEVALSMDSHVQGQKRRSEAELLRVAKDLGIDIAVIFSVYPNMKRTENSMRIHPRVEGRLVSVFDGSRLGNFDLKSQLSRPVEKPYARNEQQEALAEVSGLLGKEVGEVLTERLAQYVDAEGGMLKEWVLIIDGFNNYEVMDMEDIFRTFGGYDSHRIKSNAQNRNGHNEFFYKTSAESAVLKRDLVRMLGQIGAKGSINVSGLSILIAKGRGLKSRMNQQNSW